MGVTGLSAYVVGKEYCGLMVGRWSAVVEETARVS